jgi:hypothetical protein
MNTNQPDTYKTPDAVGVRSSARLCENFRMAETLAGAGRLRQG